MASGAGSGVGAGADGARCHDVPPTMMAVRKLKPVRCRRVACACVCSGCVGTGGRVRSSGSPCPRPQSRGGVAEGVGSIVVRHRSESVQVVRAAHVAARTVVRRVPHLHFTVYELQAPPVQ